MVYEQLRHFDDFNSLNRTRLRAIVNCKGMKSNGLFYLLHILIYTHKKLHDDLI